MLSSIKHYSENYDKLMNTRLQEDFAQSSVVSQNVRMHCNSAKLPGFSSSACADDKGVSSFTDT